MMNQFSSGSTIQPNSTQDMSTAIYRTAAKPVLTLDYPLDKINSNIWGGIENLIEHEQLVFGMEKRGFKQEANVVCRFVADKLSLSAYDKRIYIAVSSIFNSGNKIISPAQIYAKMGSKGRPNQNAIAKINESLTMMRSANLYLNNEDEIKVNTRYRHFYYDGALLPFERVNAYINNMHCASAIHIREEPPLVSFARERGQITTVPLKLLNSPVSKTVQNLCIEDYLIERIAHMRKGKIKCKLTFSTICQRCRLTEKKQKQRLPDKLKIFLTHYQNCGYIKGFDISDDIVYIQC